MYIFVGGDRSGTTKRGKCKTGFWLTFQTSAEKPMYAEWMLRPIHLYNGVCMYYRSLQNCRLMGIVCRHCGPSGRRYDVCTNAAHCRNWEFRGLPGDDLMMFSACPEKKDCLRPRTERLCAVSGGNSIRQERLMLRMLFSLKSSGGNASMTAIVCLRRLKRMTGKIPQSWWHLESGLPCYQRWKPLEISGIRTIAIGTFSPGQDGVVLPNIGFVPPPPVLKKHEIGYAISQVRSKRSWGIEGMLREIVKAIVKIIPE